MQWLLFLISFLLFVNAHSALIPDPDSARAFQRFDHVCCSRGTMIEYGTSTTPAGVPIEIYKIAI